MRLIDADTLLQQIRQLENVVENIGTTVDFLSGYLSALNAVEDAIANMPDVQHATKVQSEPCEIEIQQPGRWLETR